MWPVRVLFSISDVSSKPRWWNAAEKKLENKILYFSLALEPKSGLLRQNLYVFFPLCVLNVICLRTIIMITFCWFDYSAEMHRSLPNSTTFCFRFPSGTKGLLFTKIKLMCRHDRQLFKKKSKFLGRSNAFATGFFSMQIIYADIPRVFQESAKGLQRSAMGLQGYVMGVQESSKERFGRILQKTKDIGSFAYDWNSSYSLKTHSFTVFGALLWQ